MRSLATRYRSFILPGHRRCPLPSGGSLKRTKIASAIILFVFGALLTRPLIAQRGGGIQQDPAGDWENTGSEDRMEHGSGPELGDYLGVPINEAARFAADAWDADIVS